VTLFGQDWGGLIGLRVLAENPDRFARVVVSNTGLPTGEGPISPAFMQWKAMNQAMIDRGDMPVGSLLAQSTGDPNLAAPYDAPFPDGRYKAGPLVLPQRVPISTDDPAHEAQIAAWDVLRKWDKPFLTAFGDSDPITRGGDAVFQREVPGAKGQPHTTVEGGAHFIQESNGEELARIIVAFIEQNR
jgi:haloalkane dehalogenase